MITIDDAVIYNTPQYSPANQQYSPTEILMVKMLKQAWSDLGQSPFTEEFRTADKWVCSEEREYILSFMYICEHLGLNISQITKQMYNLDKKRSG